MLIKEEFIDGEGDTFHVKRTFDPNPSMDGVKALRDAEVGHKGESRHIGRVPGWLLALWLKEAGVAWSDIKARDEVIKKKMMSGDYSAFRNWGGTY